MENTSLNFGELNPVYCPQNTVHFLFLNLAVALCFSLTVCR